MRVSSPLVAVLLASALAFARCEGVPPPVVFIPGMAGSQIEARLDQTYVAPHWYCDQGSSDPKWKRAWFNLVDYAFPSCVVSEMHVSAEVGPSGNVTYSNARGVEVRAVDFGGVDGIKCLDPTFCSLSSYFAPVIDALVAKGYVPGESLFAAPYDFRMAGDGLTQNGYEAELTELIEGIVGKTGQAVTLVCHSMGGMVGTYFLAGKSEGWVLANVRNFVTISSPYSGASLAVQGSVSGTPMGLPFDFFLGIQDNSPSGPWLYPGSGMAKKSVPIVVTGKKNYTATREDYLVLLEHLGRKVQLKAYDAVRNQRGIEFDAEGGPKYPKFPPINHICFHGNGRKTPTQFTYDVDHFTVGEAPPNPAFSDFSDGDGIVNLDSLLYCGALDGLDTKIIPVEGQEHVGILSSEELHQGLIRVLLPQEGSPAT